MPRPIKEGLSYFAHDTDATTDEKIEALRTFYGNDGYAFYFILLERIYRSNQAELDISDADTCQILARKLLVTEQKFAEMLQKSLKVGLFDKEIFDQKKVLTSNGIKRRAGVVTSKREEMREHYQKTKKIVGVSDAETIPETTPSKVKESKVNIKESKVVSELPEIYKIYEEEYKQMVTPLMAEQLIDIEKEYGLDIFKAATKKVPQDKRNLNYVRPILEQYKRNGIPSDNGSKPVAKQKWGETW
jgi:DnaD/phage-associated family protein